MKKPPEGDVYSEYEESSEEEPDDDGDDFMDDEEGEEEEEEEEDFDEEDNRYGYGHGARDKRRPSDGDRRSAALAAVQAHQGARGDRGVKRGAPPTDPARHKGDAARHRSRSRQAAARRSGDARQSGQIKQGQVQAATGAAPKSKVGPRSRAQPQVEADGAARQVEGKDRARALEATMQALNEVPVKKVPASRKRSEPGADLPDRDRDRGSKLAASSRGAEQVSKGQRAGSPERERPPAQREGSPAKRRRRREEAAAEDGGGTAGRRERRDRGSELPESARSKANGQGDRKSARADAPAPAENGRLPAEELPKKVRRIRVDNLPTDMALEELKETAGGFGEVAAVKIWRCEDGTKTGTIEYARPEDMQLALKKLHRRRVEGWEKRLSATLMES